MCLALLACVFNCRIDGLFFVTAEQNSVDGKTVVDLSDEDFIGELGLKPLQVKRLRKEFDCLL